MKPSGSDHIVPPAHGQTYRERLPLPRLAPYAICVWLQEVGVGAAPFKRRTVPNGSVEIFCTVAGAPRVAGPETAPTVGEIPPGATVIGVRLQPWAAGTVLGLPATELVDLTLDVEELWGRESRALAERLAAAASPPAAMAVLEQEVLSRVVKAQGLDPVVHEGVRRLVRGEATEVATLADALHISERQLRRRFLASVGLAPKTLHRMLRFQRFLALDDARARGTADIGELAALAGYADQPHLTRESLRLAGRSPGELLRESALYCHGNHDHSASYAQLLRA